MFGLTDMPASTVSFPDFVTKNTLFLASARSGITLLIEQLAPGRLWLPSFYCNHMLDRLQRCGTPVRLYGIGSDLQPVSLDWTAEVEPGDLVIVTDYFGFPCNLECKQRIRKQGGVVLEDACQALLSQEVGQDADFVLYSPRKFLGVPDGGLLILQNDQELMNVRLDPPPDGWWLKAFSASLMRREFDHGSGERQWFRLFQEVEQEAPELPCAMGELSRLLVLQGFDYEQIAARRISNYRLLADKLGEYALFPNLPEGVVPLGFPVRIKNRDQIRQTCFEHSIYPPHHWPIRGVVPESFEESHHLSAEIMTLPCDQRYEQSAMEQVVDCIIPAVSKLQSSHPAAFHLQEKIHEQRT